MNPSPNGYFGLNEPAQLRITITNSGAADATNVTVTDRLTSGLASAYTLSTVTDANGNPVALNTVNGTGFNTVIDVVPAGQTRTLTFTARGNAVDTYCDTAAVLQYTNVDFGITTTPNLSDNECFRVAAPQLNIFKDFVTLDAQGNVTGSLGSNYSVVSNQTVGVRVSVYNGGTAPATGVNVSDVLTTGTLANYRVNSVPAGTTANAQGGFATSAPITIQPGQTRNFVFSVTPTADGQYCDTGSYSAPNGNPAQGNANACLTVATPSLVINKVNYTGSTAPTGTAAPTPTLRPGETYNSLITVRNNSSATASNIDLYDLLGNNPTNGTNGQPLFVNFGSGSYTIRGVTRGAYYDPASRVVSATERLTLAPGESATLLVSSTIPQGALPGEYCDTGTYAFSYPGGTPTGSARACVNVASIVATQTQMTDPGDPFREQTEFAYVSAQSVETGSNEGLRDNVISYSFGYNDRVSDPRTVGGVFQIRKTEVFYDPTPVRDPVTGAIVSDYTNPSRVALVEGVDYFLTNVGTSAQTVRLRSDFVIQPNAVLYTRHTVIAPAGTARAQQYFSGFYWDGRGIRSANTYGGISSEPSTIIAQ
ncbi:hypothetical protein [Deinococcus multiflagellatus]|uniref:DUF11 domain-containing protein n=1 Tax=Deinococcus multiflagellatus TaxID=1656887 RepID=A0ABW1ZK58_9DEIO